MPNRRKGALGSFGAPLDELLPTLGSRDGAREIKVDVHRLPAQPGEKLSRAQECRIFMLNQSLYERANK